MFKKLSSRFWLIAVGVACAVLALVVIVFVANGSISIVFVFPPAVFAVALIASGVSMGETRPAKKSDRVKKEEPYISPFFIEDGNEKNEQLRGSKNKTRRKGK